MRVELTVRSAFAPTVWLSIPPLNRTNLPNYYLSDTEGIANGTALVQAASMQPVSVAICADCDDFQNYDSGVFDLSCGTDLDHGVLVVGYGARDCIFAVGFLFLLDVSWFAVQYQYVSWCVVQYHDV
jgi:hypothetical protein